MKLEIASSILQCPYLGMAQASAPFAPSLWCKRNNFRANQRVVSLGVFLNNVSSIKVVSTQRFGRGLSIRACCRVDDDDGGDYVEESEEEHKKSEGSCSVSKNSVKDSNFPSQFDLLDPAMLGIELEPPTWPERERVRLVSIEHRANSIRIPLSVRMIQEKLKWELGVKDLGELRFSPVRKACSSMVFIIVELQRYGLQMREALCDEDLESIASKVQQEMHLSFAWMFQQVFSQTPSLMIHVMVLLANFCVFSASHSAAIAKASEPSPGPINPPLVTKNPNVVPHEFSQSPDQELNESDMRLWNSIVDEATNMRGLEDVGLDSETKINFVSPLSVEIESEDSVDYHKTDFLYQIHLSHDPYSTLLLCNYAQFLQIVRHDYDRAEECYKRAMQVKPLDPEALSRYADFLWKIRQDFSTAEDIYQQSIAASAEPGSSYYASQYANFLWSTGGEDTCFPLSVSYDSSNS